MQVRWSNPDFLQLGPAAESTFKKKVGKEVTASETKNPDGSLTFEIYGGTEEDVQKLKGDGFQISIT